MCVQSACLNVCLNVCLCSIWFAMKAGFECVFVFNLVECRQGLNVFECVI